MNAIKSFLKPQTPEQMYRNIAIVLAACTATLFMVVVMPRWDDVGHSIYVRDPGGNAVLKVSPDNSYVVYRFK